MSLSTLTSKREPAPTAACFIRVRSRQKGGCLFRPEKKADMQFESTIEFARAQDAEDPLRNYRDRFHFPSLGTPELVYFTGHSLGLQPKTVREAVELELDEWAKYGVEGHFHATNPWYSYHERLTPPMAEIVGAPMMLSARAIWWPAAIAAI